jgi:predicted alpha/beta hydrolase family esterase
MSTVVIVPGLHDSGPQHWQSRWQRQLPNSLRVEQTHWDVPDLKRWSGNVLQVLNDLDRRGEDCWIVAHSFGCLASVFALEQAFKAGALSNVRGIFLVAPADPQKFGVADMLPARPLQVAGGLSEGHRQISGRRIAGRRIAGRRIAGRMIASRSDPW